MKLNKSKPNNEIKLNKEIEEMIDSIDSLLLKGFTLREACDILREREGN